MTRTVLRDSGLTSCNKRYLELLHLAKLYGENNVEVAIELLLGSGQIPLKEDILDLLKQVQIPQHVEIVQPKLDDYDGLHSFQKDVA